MSLPNPQKNETFLSRLQFRHDLRVFPVSDPTTMYIRGSQCRVAVQYHDYDHVEIYTNLYAAFGVRLIVEQDEAGVYVIVKRRRLLGLFSRSEVRIHVPHYCNLAFSLTPGDIELQQINGVLEIPPFEKAQAPKIIVNQESTSPPSLQESIPERLESGQ